MGSSGKEPAQAQAEPLTSGRAYADGLFSSPPRADPLHARRGHCLARSSSFGSEPALPRSCRRSHPVRISISHDSKRSRSHLSAAARIFSAHCFSAPVPIVLKRTRLSTSLGAPLWGRRLRRPRQVTARSPSSCLVAPARPRYPSLPQLPYVLSRSMPAPLSASLPVCLHPHQVGLSLRRLDWLGAECRKGSPPLCLSLTFSTEPRKTVGPTDHT